MDSQWINLSFRTNVDTSSDKIHYQPGRASSSSFYHGDGDDNNKNMAARNVFKFFSSIELAGSIVSLYVKFCSRLYPNAYNFGSES